MVADDTSKPMRERMSAYILGLQDTIVAALEAADPSAPKFKRDEWERAQGGRGVSCVFACPPPAPSSTSTSSALDSGFEPTPTTVLEKAGVNISIVHGTLPPAAVRQMVADHGTIPFDPARPQALPFFAAGISLVIHPRNPSAPTVHANYRYFELSAPSSEGTDTTTTSAETRTELDANPLAWWFGGGADLTPSYLFDDDATHFHGALKAACDAHGSALHPAFKKWCDEYFFIPHRGETRGVGGIFFDDLCDAPHKRLGETGAAGEAAQAQDAAGVEAGKTRPRTPDEIFAFVRACGDAFVPSYLPILLRRKNTPADAEKRRWQLLRRGRYVEFNLVYDRGTKFGLMTPGARIESILMSLPETARWEYMSEVGAQAGSEEARLLEVVRNPRDWV